MSTRYENPTVLIADSKKIDAAYLKIMLERDGYTVEVAEDEADILEKIKQNPYHAILLANQPFNNLNGIEVTKKVRDHQNKTHTYSTIIGLASSAMQIEIRSFLAAGADICLPKPIYKNELCNIMQMVVQQSYYGSV